ncbi:HAD hydrolase-like protein, partial [Xanthomonas sp. Kuri4-3]
GMPPAACVYVGDDERDILAARAAGMPSVAVLWGYRLDTDAPSSWQADVLVERPEQLWQADAWPATAA